MKWVFSAWRGGGLSSSETEPELTPNQRVENNNSEMTKLQAWRSVIFYSLLLSVLMFSISLITRQVRLSVSVQMWVYDVIRSVWDVNDPGSLLH